jgi:predicted small secreted protein
MMEWNYIKLIIGVIAGIALGVMLTVFIVNRSHYNIETFKPCVDSIKGPNMPHNVPFIVFAKVYPDGRTSCIAYPTDENERYRYEVDPVQTQVKWFPAGGSNDAYDDADCDRFGNCPGQPKREPSSPGKIVRGLDDCIVSGDDSAGAKLCP